MPDDSLWDELEVGRRLVHASGVILPLAYLAGIVNWGILGFLLSMGVIVVATLEYCRLSLGFTHAIYERLTRPYEEEYVAGYALYMGGMAAAWLLFPPEAAIAGMLMLALGDPVSGMLNNMVEPNHLAAKLPVLAVMFAVCLGLAAPLTLSAGGPGVGHLAALAGALGAALVDGFKPTIRGRIVDDNLTIPLAGGLPIVVVLTVL